MAKEFDIYVGGQPKIFDLCVSGQPKSFDIHLNRRLTECDILIYTIPFRDGLIATSRMILDAYLERLAFQQYIKAADAISPMVYIEETAKTCVERPQVATTLAANMEIQTHYALSPLQAEMEIGTADGLKIIQSAFTSAGNRLQFAASVVDAMVSKQFGYGNSGIEMRVNVRGTTKRSNLQPAPGIPIVANIENVFTQYHLGAAFATAFAAELTSLSYALYAAGSTSMQLSAAVTGTEIHFPLGHGQSGLEIAVSAKSAATKMETAQNAVAFSAQATGDIVQFVAPGSEVGGIVLTATVTPTLRRHRLLSEMDADTLLSFDEMTLDDIDYVIL